MDEKEIKGLLKNAREAIQNKNFNDAAKICNQILQHHPTNYMALVFAGRCYVELGNPTSAREYYNKAIAADGSQILAWQGLHQYYEKYNIWDENCISCLRRLIDLTSDEKKKSEYRYQLAITFAKAERLDESVNEFLLLADVPEGHIKIEEAVIKHLGEAHLNNANGVDMVKNAYISSVKDAADDSSERVMLELKYMHFLVKNRCWTEAYNLCSRLGILKEYGERYACDAATLLCERYIQDVLGEFDEDLLGQLDDYFDDNDGSNGTVSGNKTRFETCALAVSAMLNVIDRNWLGITEVLEIEKLLSLKAPFLWFLLADAKLHLHDYFGAENAAETAQREWIQPADAYRVHRIKAAIIQATALTEIGSKSSLEKALDIYKRALLEITNSEANSIATKAKLGLALALTMTSEVPAAQNLLDDVRDRSTDYFLTLGFINLHRGDYADCKLAVEHLQAIVSELEDEDAAKCHYLSGRIIWDTNGDKGLAIKEFLEAAKLDPYYGDVFYYMGLYYVQFNADSYNPKALKCYERAFSLAGRYKSHFGIALSDCYRKLQIHDKNLALLLEITESQAVESCTWAWLRLGLEYLSEGKADDAVRVLQIVLRVANNDVRCWECLGEAYALRGSYASALRTFEKLITLEKDAPKLIYANYRIAMINLVMRHYQEAACGFRNVLKLENDHLPSMIGLGRSLMYSAKYFFSEARFQRSLDDCVQAIETLAQALMSNPQCTSGWHLLGVTLTFLTHFDDRYVEQLRFPSLLHLIGRDDFQNNKLHLLKLGSRFFAQAIALNSKLAQIWHDLGMNLFYQASGGGSESGKRQELVSQCLACLKHALQLDPTKPRFWLSLAGVAMSDIVSLPELSQHCFIKSLTLEPHQASAWTGLGCCYKKFGELQMAHKCFEKAQSIDPEYANCWIGQALIAEEVQPQEALDLFRHAVELGNNAQALVGYGYHVVTAITAINVDTTSTSYQYAIEHVHAVPTAQAALQKYSWLRPTDVCSMNLLALILEKEKMLTLAGSLYLQILEFLKQLPASDMVEQNFEEIVAGNACRLFGKLGNNGTMRKLAGKMSTKDTFENQCMRALAYYRLGQWDKATELYSAAVYSSETKIDQDEVKLALSLIAAKEGRWDEYDRLFSDFKTEEYTLVISWSLIFDLLESGIPKADGMRTFMYKALKANEWISLLTAICCLYCKKFTLSEIQQLLHQVPYDHNMRFIFYYLWKRTALWNGMLEESDTISCLGRWRALFQMRECENKETLYSKIRHIYPDIFENSAKLC